MVTKVIPPQYGSDPLGWLEGRGVGVKNIRWQGLQGCVFYLEHNRTAEFCCGVGY